MIEWILRKRWRIIAVGVLLVALPLLVLAVVMNVQITRALEGRLIKETDRYSQIAARIVEERLASDIRLGSIFVTRKVLLRALEERDQLEVTGQLRNLVDGSPQLERAFISSERGTVSGSGSSWPWPSKARTPWSR